MALLYTTIVSTRAAFVTKAILKQTKMDRIFFIGSV
jgi:hypothetical protein